WGLRLRRRLRRRTEVPRDPSLLDLAGAEQPDPRLPRRARPRHASLVLVAPVSRPLVCGTSSPKRTEEVGHAAAWGEEGHEASAPVRAHQGERAKGGSLGEARRGDRRANGQQGTRSRRRDDEELAEQFAQLLGA